jgi:hypothetical protein
MSIHPSSHHTSIAHWRRGFRRAIYNNNPTSDLGLSLPQVRSVVYLSAE